MSHIRSTAVITASWSSCEGTLQLPQQRLWRNSAVVEYLSVPLQLLQFAVATAVVLRYMRHVAGQPVRGISM